MAGSLSTRKEIASLQISRPEAFRPQVKSDKGGSSARKTVQWTVFSENGPAGPRGYWRGKQVPRQIDKSEFNHFCPPPTQDFPDTL